MEQQGRTNASMASVVGLDESKFIVQDKAGAPKHGMTTIGNIFLTIIFVQNILNELSKRQTKGASIKNIQFLDTLLFLSNVRYV